jgi:acetyl esterase/lipase
MGREILSMPAPPADFRVPYGPGEFQFGDLRVPDGRGPHPVVIVIHGGFWRATLDLLYMGNVAAALTAAGVATWNIEYRRIGQTGGGYPGALEDTANASAHLTNMADAHRLDISRVVAAGHSAGGHLALWLATAKRGLPLRGAVSLAGVADLRRAWELKLSDNVVGEFIGGSPDQYPDRYREASPIEKLPASVPQRLIHGEADEVVPIELSERYERAATSKGDDCVLLRMESDHFDVADPRSKVWPRVMREILDLGGRDR